MLAGLRCTPRSESLGSGVSPSQLLSRVSGRDGLICLSGDWADGSVLIAWEPLLRLAAGADPWSALAVQPRLDSVDSSIVGGGWIGQLGYDDDENHLAFYDHMLRWDAGQGWRLEMLASPEREVALAQARLEIIRLLDAGPNPETRESFGIGDFRYSAAQRVEHLVAVERAIGLIRAGEVYQVNICTRLQANPSGDSDPRQAAVSIFNAANERLRPAHGGYLSAADGRSVLSLSPELFLRRRGPTLSTDPIKGTSARLADGAAVDPGPSRLRGSAKEVAENVMIVDLMRNDLARICEPGSVRTPNLLRVEPHAGVWHLVSTVQGRVRAGVSDAQVAASCFPPGSVTGAPKIRAQQVIADLESTRRGGYTGAIGFLSPSWGMELSVAIRTFEIAGPSVQFGVGGGVTADSVPMLEWAECLQKAAPVISAAGGHLNLVEPAMIPTASQLDGGLLETMLAIRGEVQHLADHLARLGRSCRELFAAELPDDLPARIVAVAGPGSGDGTRPERAIVRVVVRAGPDGLTITVAAAPAAPARTARTTCDARVALRSKGIWRHKWADRGELAAIEAEQLATPIFLDEQNQLLETSRGNLFVLDADGVLRTPPLTDELLPGVTRRCVLDAAADLGMPTRIALISLPELRRSPAFWTSSLSGLVEIARVDDVALPACTDWIEALRALVHPV
ncbi:para-aminobenzoate synthetase/4-amino-4-deoxychorismate lyase [Jatrophihabitans sp. GAS493]|uniref:bifunctional chorismate-binding protein/class IV aminotransferase n=1 Tax=Jatrophihabitans sp. GAS493 TaxID=1907575 RepID=UPI000BB6A522|nr:bifunctional chorismate-binding protein/class IV aminotransferase [Jatrophihabitans sp. GAS493]SOD70432.1 para-aminobenzoate synthetase/4-amino-4-deoxychorismate lyase [Jatrophihabitans sp. GAS493]